MKYDSDNQRVHRISSVIRKEVAQIIQNEINDPRIKEVVVTEVQMSKDLKHASCLLYTSPSPRDATLSRMPSSA